MAEYMDGPADLDIATITTRMGENTMGDADIQLDLTPGIHVEHPEGPDSTLERAELYKTPIVHDDGDMGDLFGDDDDAGSQKAGTRQSSPTPSIPGSADGISAAERRKRKAMEYEEDEEAAEEEVKTEAQMHIPNLPLPTASDGNYWVLRMPNFIKLESHPFDQDTYQGAGLDMDDGSQGLSTREKSMSVKLEVENTIRWRWVKGPDGEMRKQSNSRVIKWSDGSMSLQLGKELFDVSSNIDVPATTAPRPAVNNPSQETQSAHNISRNQGLTYLFAQHVRAELLQAEAAITGTLTLRPTGMQSETHRKLVKAVGQRHSKVTRLMMAPAPTRESEMERAEQLKAAKKAQNSKKRRTAPGESPAKRRPAAARSTVSRRNRDMDWSDEDPSDEDDTFSGGRIGRVVPTVGKRAGPGDYETDEFVVDDDDEEEGAQRGDVLDEADEAIEEAHRVSRRDKKTKRTTKTSSDEDDDDEDAVAKANVKEANDDAAGDAMVGSDDENEVAVRPATGRKPRRLAMEVDDDDDE
ncbi:hypothetical protein FRB96_002904 [Tulasnella sp. 330]|nr:hypothetical protein FRB96_002904 [Tulasnella sp. 330]KAG8884361.1 hypothetical protein FRB98_002440 [Tulasnella sp. 332]KAG8884938.1 hypothetical protein FRB97_002766 [Tulasnella sp. 331]